MHVIWHSSERAVMCAGLPVALTQRSLVNPTPAAPAAARRKAWRASGHAHGHTSFGLVAACCARTISHLDRKVSPEQELDSYPMVRSNDECTALPSSGQPIRAASETAPAPLPTAPAASLGLVPADSLPSIAPGPATTGWVVT